MTDPTGGDARPPAAPWSPNSRATSGPGPSAASPAPPWAPALNSALGASPALSSSLEGMAGSARDHRPAGPHILRASGARMEGHWRLFLALFPPWPRATAINF